MSTFAVVFYAAMHQPYRYGSGSVHERHGETMALRSLREGAPIRALLDHDDTQELGTTANKSLCVTVEAGGLRCELRAIPDTPPGRRLAAALASGSVTGC